MLSDPQEIKKVGFDDFSGGLRRNVDPTRLQDTEYPILINGRSRYGSIRPIKLPALQFGPAVKAQGCYASKNIVVIFFDGLAYYRDYGSVGSSFMRIQDFNLEPSLDFFYAEQIPDSYFNFNRIPTTAGVASDGVDVASDSTISASGSGIVVQDGIHQPWLIQENLTARLLQKFHQWMMNGTREYVPIGLNMLYHDGILYVASPDGKKLYRSVTGRPLDFVIAIKDDGDKLDDNLFVEEADRMSHRVNNASITALCKLNLGPEFQNLGAPFMVSTTSGTYKVTPNLADTLFGEPKMRNNDLFPTNILNQFSYSPTKRNDIDFIDETGLRSYNALSEDVSISRDDALSGPVFKLFEGVQQTWTCCTFFDNYTLFAVDTIFGPGVLVYDNLLNRFSALDIFDGIGYIKQFCQTNIRGIKRLFFITTTGGFYEYYGSATTATCKIYTKEVTEDDAETHLKLMRIKITLQDVEESGTISATPFTERRRETTVSKTVDQNLFQEPYPQDIPFGTDNKETTEHVSWDFQSSGQADKVGCLIEFNFMCDLQGIQVNTKPIDSVVDPKQAGKLYKR